MKRWQAIHRFPPTACAKAQLVADGLVIVAVTKSSAPITKIMDVFIKRLRGNYGDPQQLDNVVMQILNRL